MNPQRELVTAATDYLLAAVAFAGAFTLKREEEGRPFARRLWACGFAAIGAAALFGGAWHGTAGTLSPGRADVLWKATLAAAGCAGFFFLTGAAVALLSRRVARLIAAFAAVKLALFLAAAVSGDTYDPVIRDSVATLVALLALALARWREGAARWIIVGVGFSVIAAIVESARPDWPDPFGPDAVYHLVQAASLFFFWRAGRLFGEN